MTDRVRVGDVLRLQRRAVAIEPTTNYTLIGVYSFGKGILHREPIPGAELGDYRFFRVEPGDLVLSNIQAWEGAIAHADQEDAGTVGTHRFLTYTPRDDRIDTKWARWFFLSEPGMKLVRHAAPGTTMRNRTLAIDRFEALEIPLPPIDEQRRVADSIDHVHMVSATAVQMTARAEALAEALTSSIVFRLDLDESERAQNGWQSWMLGDLLTLDVREVEVDSADAYEIAGIYSFGRGIFRRAAIDGTQTSYKKLHRLAPGQIVMSRLKAWEGAFALVPESFDGCFVSPEFPTFTVRQGMANPEFLGRVITSKLFWSRLQTSSHGIGARRERVSAEKLLSHEVSLPPIAQQRSAVHALAAAVSARAGQLSRIPLVSALVPAALNHAFAGLN